MSDETIAVTIQETTLPVSIDTGTPQISIIEQSGDVTIIEANPIQVTATEGDATVVINSGVYGSAGPINVEDLVGYITRLQLDPDLTTDMEHLDAMWTQIGGKTVLLGSDGIAIRLAGQAYTDSSILAATNSINADVDSKINNSTAANSLITDALDDRITSVNMGLNLDIVEANTAIENLDLRVTGIQQGILGDLGVINTSLGTLGQTVTNNKAEIDSRLSALDLFVGTTDTSIYSVVSRLDAIDGATGNIVDLESSIVQTADSINLRVTSLETSIDGRITSAEGRIRVTEEYIESAVLKFSEIDGTTTELSSYIQQTANSIDSRITSVETSIDGRFDTAESRIYQTEQGISSTVSLISGITGDNGLLYSLGSRIDQQAGSIEMAVQESARINGKLIETSSGLSLLTDSVGLFVDKYDEVAGRVTSAELILGVDGINISLIESALDLQSYTIGTIQSILTNQWTVNISEDIYGNTYTTGFGLVLHPIWLVGEEYTAGFIVTVDTAVYECTFSHTSSAVNSPLSVGGASYWSLLPDGVKSEFNIQADAFRIMTSSGPVPVFEVTGDVITLNADVTIGGTLTIGYSDVVGAPTSLADLDPAQNAKLLGMEAGATANNVFFQNTEPVGAAGDIWLDTDDNQLYTHDGSAWIPGKSGTDGLRGEAGVSIAWKGSLSAAPLNPEELWAYYNTTYKASYVYSDSVWYQMSVDGTPGSPGVSITWKGSSSSPPVSPRLNWAYYDTDNGVAYIYNGTGWEVLAQDGLDGYNGTSTFTYYQTTTPTTGKVNELWFSTTTKLLRRCTVANSTNLTDWPIVGNSFDNTNQLIDGQLLGQTALWTSVTGRPTSLANINSAEYAKLPTATVKALAYLDTVGDGQVTTISGGKIKTGVIYGNNSYSYWDLTNNKMYFTASATLEFAANAYIKFGSYARLSGFGTEWIGFHNNQLYLASGNGGSSGGSALSLYNGYAELKSFDSADINITSADDIFITSADDTHINAGTGNKIYIKFNNVYKIQCNEYGFRPYANALMLLGDTGYRWSGVFGSAFYDEGGLFQDLQDDLLVMSEIKPKKHINIDPESGEKQTSTGTLKDPNTGLEYIDLHSLPRWMTNYDDVVKKLRADSGDLLSDEDIDELILDDKEAGWMLSRNKGKFDDLTSGAVRQMDLENKEMYELIFSRLTALEKENKELKERVTVLEGE